MRKVFFTLAVLALCALSERPASAQALDCTVAPQSVCADEEVLALESERATLVNQLAALDSQHAALGGEQAWIDGLGACGEDADCYRSAYYVHNLQLRETVDGFAAAETAPTEESTDAATAPSAESEAPAARRAPREDTRGGDGPIYAPGGLPGWGFFTAIGVTLLILYALLRARAKCRRELRAEEAQLHDDWR